MSKSQGTRRRLTLSSDVGEERVGESVPRSEESTDRSSGEDVVGEGSRVCEEREQGFSSRDDGEARL